MRKRLISILLTLVICLSTFPFTVYAKEDAFEVYQKAIQTTMSSGNWREELTMDADMIISNGNAKTKTKVTMNALMDISNYSEINPSNLEVSGSASMSLMGQKYAYDVQYKNGVAHYKYTEPNQTSTDIKMDPNYFDFNIFTRDMLKKAKISRNKISFTISGDKMKEVGVAAVNMMTGVENLNYGDVDVEVIIDKATGTVDMILMIFHASLTYQGYDAIVDYSINYDFSTEFNAELIAYTAFPDSKIGTQQEVKIQFSLYINGMLASIDQYELDISDTDIVEVIKTIDSNGSKIITFKGVSQGNSELIFTEKTTGITLILPVVVEEQCNYFRCSAFPIPYESIGGIYIADYSCEVDENDNHNITFNAYNTSYAYGVIEVYNENGSLIKLVPLAPRSDGSGMEKVVNGFKWVWGDIKDIFDGETPFYTKDSNAKHTPVKLDNIPKNAEIVITSDGNESAFATLYTGIDVFVRTVFAASSIDLKTEGQFESVKELMNALLDSLLKSISHEEAKKMIKQGLIKEATESISTSIAFASSKESISGIYETVYNLFENLNIDAESIILNVLKGMGYSVADTVFTTVIPLYKIVNFTDQILEIAWPLTDYQFNLGRGKMEIHVSKHGIHNFLVNSAVTIKQESTFSEKTTLDAYIVSKDNDLQSIPSFVTWDMKNYNVYSITLRENGKEIQPNEEIEVKIPVPIGADEQNCVVYRIEDDGKRTLLSSTVNNGYLVFKTSHLSYYIIGESDNFNLILVIIGSAILLLISIYVISNHKKNNRKQNL